MGGRTPAALLAALVLLAGACGLAAAAQDCSREARTLEVGREVSGSVAGVEPLCYRFEVSEAARHHVYTTGPLDTVGRLLDADCRLLAEDDDGGGENNFRIERTLEPGVYHVAVRGYGPDVAGPFTLFVNAARLVDVEPGSARSAALRPGEVHYYRLRVSRGGEYAFRSTGSVDLRAVLVCGDGAALAEDDDGGGGENFLVTCSLGPGTYVLGVSGFDDQSCGPYGLRIGGGGGCEAAAAALAGNAVSGRADGAAWAYYRFDSPGGYCRFYTTGDVDTVGRLLDDDCRLVAEDDDGGEGPNFALARRLPRGTCYVAVRGYDEAAAGRYTLHFEASPAEGVRRGCDDGARPIAAGGEVHGSLSGRRPIYYRFDLGSHAPVEVFSSGEADTVGALLDEDCLPLGEDDDGGEGLNFSISELLAPGRYYVEVRGYDDDTRGAFALRLRAPSPVALELGNPVRAELTARERHLYLLEVSVSGSYALYSTGEVDLKASLLDAGFRMLAEDDDGGQGTNFLISRRLEPGSYYLSVAGFGGSEHGPYTVRAER